MVAYGMVLIGAALAGLALLLAVQKTRTWPKRAALFIACMPIGLGLLGMGGMRAWVAGGVVPAPQAFTVARGIRYERRARTAPTPLVWHLTRVDLSTTGLSFFVTAGDPSRILPSSAKTPSKIATEAHAELVLSAGFFEPHATLNPFEPPPPEGAAMRPLGFNASRGVSYGAKLGPTLAISETNVASIGEVPATPYNAISGDCIFLSGGKIAALDSCQSATELLARSVVGLDATSKTLYLVAVDGARDGRSPGVTVTQMAEMLLAEGVDTALQLGVGPSVALVGRAENGTIGLLSSPVAGGIPDFEMPVATHLSVMSEPRTTASN
jgi:hypothetical protein